MVIVQVKTFTEKSIGKLEVSMNTWLKEKANEIIVGDIKYETTYERGNSQIHYSSMVVYTNKEIELEKREDK